MTVGDLFRVSCEVCWVEINQTFQTIYGGLFENVPEKLLDCTIKSVAPYYNGCVEMFVIELND